MIGPAEIEDILLDVSEAIAQAGGVQPERRPGWPVPAGMAANLRVRNEARASALPHHSSSSDEHSAGSGA